MDTNKTTAVDAINLLVIASLALIIDKYPILKDLLNSSKSDNPTEEWDFFMISACAGVVLMTDEDYDGEHQAIESRLNELDKNYLRAVNDLAVFMKKTPGGMNKQMATIGYWVLWNVKRYKPNDDEIEQLSLPIGSYVMGVIHRIRQEKIGQD